MRSKKAQMFSMDAVASLMVFLGVASFAIFLITYLPQDDGMSERAAGVADYLVMSRLGSENMLDASLIGNFSSDYGAMKRELGVPENFYFRVVNMSSYVLKQGGLEPASASSVADIRRIGVLDGNYVYVDTMLWK